MITLTKHIGNYRDTTKAFRAIATNAAMFLCAGGHDATTELSRLTIKGENLQLHAGAFSSAYDIMNDARLECEDREGWVE